MGEPWKKRVVLGLKAGATLAALYALMKAIPLEVLTDTFSRFDPRWIFLIAALLLLEFFVSAAKTAYMMGIGFGHVPSLMRVNAIKCFFNLFLPSGVGGEIARTWHITSVMKSEGKAIAVVFAERYSGFCVQVGAAWLVLGYLYGGEYHLPSLSGIWIWLWPLLGILAPFALWNGGLSLFAWTLMRLPSRLIPQNLRRFKGEKDFGTEIIAAYAKNIPMSFGILAFSLLNHTMVMTLTYAAFLSLGGNMSWLALAPIILFTSLASLLSITLGGLGLVEGAYGLAFHLSHQEASLGVGVSLILRVALLIPILMGAFWFWKGWRMDQGRSRRIRT